MKQANQGKSKVLDGRGLRIGIVASRFNADITQALQDACKSELLALGVKEDCITRVSVPGALEVPLALQALARLHVQDALIALGCVIRGETYHFELVANESAHWISRIALEQHIPIANAILTTETLAQAQMRQHDKGREAARTAVEMATLLRKLTWL